MTAIYSFANNKGGCGKTSAVVLLATALADRGRRTLIVDLDPQGNATEDVGASHHEGPTVTDALNALFDGQPLPDGLIRETPTSFKSGGVLHVVGANVSLDPVDTKLSAREDGVDGVISLVEQVGAGYDAVVCDTRPTLGALTRGGVAVADIVIVPANMQDHASLRSVVRAVSAAADNDPAPEIVILRTRSDGRATRWRRTVDRGADDHLGEQEVPVLDTRLLEDAAVQQARARMEPLTKGAALSNARSASVELERLLVEAAA